NYERLHYFDSSDFVGIVCDESSAIKNFEGKRQEEVVTFMRKVPYRLLCTATPSPNDYIELGTSSEALGQLGRMDMLGRFFRNDENSLHPIWYGSKWRFKKHAKRDFWRWVCSWARACRKPEDVGFEDSRFLLPELVVNREVVENKKPLNGKFFRLPARTLQEQRKENKETLEERCEKVAERIYDVDVPFHLVWCHLNAEADYIERMVDDAVQVSGSMSDDLKEERLAAFSDGEIPVLVIKPRIGGFGLNWQHCSHMTYFPSHSYEQYYQAIRRCWRYGQKNPVVVDVITTEGGLGVLRNLERKSEQAEEMFSMMVEEMSREMNVKRIENFNKDVKLPKWLGG
ncbi:MAG: helicase, partial [Candidatus Lokiarchaeota archaeon]|nr:helicase [Candidatus Lokiarchaeota archaeon]